MLAVSVFESFQMKKALMAKLALMGASAAALLAAPAHAALDVAVTTGITEAQTNLLAVYSALTTAGIAIWVGKVIYNKFRVR